MNSQVETVSSYEKLAIGADAIVILTEWHDFKNINWSILSSLMRKPSWIFDCRDVIDFGKFEEKDLNIWKLGHGSNNKNSKNID